jgi:hypothetical protein
MNTQITLGLHRPFIMGVADQQRVLAETRRILAEKARRVSPTTPPAPALNALRERAKTVWDSHGVSRRLFPTQASFIQHCLKTARNV